MEDTVELSTLGEPIKTAYEGQPDTNAFTDAEKEKLAGIQNQATKNASDADLLNRSNHTGTQLAETISDLPDLLGGKVDKVTGKGLSEEDFTTEEKIALGNLIERGGFTLRRLGPWNASTNSPQISNGVGLDGQFYVVDVSGTQNLGNGDRMYRQGDWVVYCEGIWHRLTGSDPTEIPWDEQNIYVPRGAIGPAIPAAYFISTGQYIPSSGYHDLIFTSAKYDHFSLFTPEGFTMPEWASHMRVTASLHLSPNPNGYRSLAIRIDGEYVTTNRKMTTPSATTYLPVSSPIMQLDPGTQVGLTVWQNSEIDLLVGFETWMQIELYESI